MRARLRRIDPMRQSQALTRLPLTGLIAVVAAIYAVAIVVTFALGA